MADIDIDMIEAIIEAEEKKQVSHTIISLQRGRASAESDATKRKRGASGSRHRSRSNRSRSNSNDKKRRETRDWRRHKRSDSQDSKSEDEFQHKIQKQQEALKKQIEEAKKQAEEAQREDCTVQCIRVHLNATERDIYSFFSKANVGKVRDVRLIKDQRTGKSKGVAYVEFYTPESVLLAMALSGQQLLGLPLIIQASQAEINRQAQATKYRQELQKKHSTKDPTVKLFIGNILPMMTESDVRQIFSPFGEIELIEVPRDPHTGKNRRVAFVTYSRKKDAKVAIKEMDEFKLKDKVIEVREAEENESEYFRDAAPDFDLEDKGYTIGSGKDRHALMTELNKSKGGTNELVVQKSNLNAISNCLLLNNMFDPTSVDMKDNPNFFSEVKDQVLDICEDCGKVEQVWVDKESEGNVWVKFSKDSVLGAERAQLALNNKFFDEREIKASFVPEMIFNTKVPK